MCLLVKDKEVTMPFIVTALTKIVFADITEQKNGALLRKASYVKWCGNAEVP